MNVPNMGDSISEGTIVELCFKTGDYVNVDDIVAIIETDRFLLMFGHRVLVS